MSNFNYGVGKISFVCHGRIGENEGTSSLSDLGEEPSRLVRRQEANEPPEHLILPIDRSMPTGYVTVHTYVHHTADDDDEQGNSVLANSYTNEHETGKKTKKKRKNGTRTASCTSFEW